MNYIILPDQLNILRILLERKMVQFLTTFFLLNSHLYLGDPTLCWTHSGRFQPRLNNPWLWEEAHVNFPFLLPWTSSGSYLPVLGTAFSVITLQCCDGYVNKVSSSESVNFILPLIDVKRGLRTDMLCGLSHSVYKYLSMSISCVCCLPEPYCKWSGTLSL
jgi:hypothetical protein